MKTITINKRSFTSNTNNVSRTNPQSLINHKAKIKLMNDRKEEQQKKEFINLIITITLIIASIIVCNLLGLK